MPEKPRSTESLESRTNQRSFMELVTEFVNNLTFRESLHLAGNADAFQQAVGDFITRLTTAAEVPPYGRRLGAVYL